MEHTDPATTDVSEKWDYEIPHKCQYEVEAKGTPEGVGGCGEPACYRVWWNEYAMGDIHEVGIMYVCQEHFNFMRECEQKADNTIEVDDPTPTDEDLRVEAMISLFVTMKARIQDFQYIRLLSYPHICKKDVIKILDDHQKQMEDIIRWEIVPSKKKKLHQIKAIFDGNPDRCLAWNRERNLQPRAALGMIRRIKDILNID